MTANSLINLAAADMIYVALNLHWVSLNFTCYVGVFRHTLNMIVHRSEIHVHGHPQGVSSMRYHEIVLHPCLLVQLPLPFLAFCQVKFFFIRSRFCTPSSQIPQTSQSCKTSFSPAPKTQCSDNCCSSAAY